VTEHPTVRVVDAEHPSGGIAAPCDGRDHINMRPHAELLTATRGGLNRLQQAAFPEHLDVLNGHLTHLVGEEGACAEFRKQIFGDALRISLSHSRASGHVPGIPPHHWTSCN
jgi:hypothetical protein